MLEETIESSGSLAWQRDGKAFSPEIRTFIYDATDNHIPTKNVPKNVPIDQD